MPIQAPGFPGDMTQEEIEEKLFLDFRAAASGNSSITVTPETAAMLVKLMDDAGKGQPKEEEDK
jgi:plasmid maintenance system antidote protein VapI